MLLWTNNLQNDPKITWKIVKKCHLYQPGQKTCQMCLLEKYYIIQGMKKNNSLNKKTDIGNKCVHVRDATFAYAITWRKLWGCKSHSSTPNTMPRTVCMCVYRLLAHYKQISSGQHDDREFYEPEFENLLGVKGTLILWVLKFSFFYKRL